MLAVTCILIVVLLSSGRATAASEPDPPIARERAGALQRAGLPAIRTTDRRLHALVRDGMRSSETFRALVDRLERSDVVVYLRCERDASTHVSGRLTFVSAVGGLRYVMVRLRPLSSRTQQLAIMAHELRHAVEIADAPTVVDDITLGVEYQRIGHVNRWSHTAGLAFDSQAAIRAGADVLRELTGTAAD
jgi:hypothetical protein